MWLKFFMALPVFALLLYVPGCFFSGLLAPDLICALVTAPFMSVCLYTLLGIVYEMAGISCGFASMVIPVVVVGLVCSVLVARRRSDGEQGNPFASIFTKELVDELKVLLPYVVFGAAVCLVYFIKPLDGPESFTWRTDNCFHLNLANRFVSTGNWSMLHGSIYEDPSRGALTNNLYYPAGWHVLVALLSSTLHVSTPFGANVVNAVLIAVTIPSCAYLLMRTVYGDKPLAVRLGAIFPLAFGVFPWHIIIPEAKESFFMGMCTAPACIALFILACESVLEGKFKWRSAAFVLIALFASVLAHPICVFSIGVLLVPYIVWFIWRLTGAKGLSPIARVLCELAFFAFVAAMWAFCFNVPSIHEMTVWIHYAYTRRQEALMRIVFMGFKDVPAQPLLALFVWIGVAYSLYRTRYLWMTCSFLIFSLFYFVDATTDRFIKRLLTGFWFTDFNRLAASALIVAVPLAALGLFAVVRVAQHLFKEIAAKNDATARRYRTLMIPLLLAVVSAGVIYYPSFHMPHAHAKVKTGFWYVSKRAREYNDFDKNMLREDEIEFLKEVKEAVGDDLVLNFPCDGSSFAYVTNDVNVYARRLGNAYLDERAKLIAANVDDYASNAEVKEAINELDARYVLLLDIDENASEESSIYEDGFNANTWRGFCELDDETPGFEVVLSEGDMRLYRILDEAA